LNDIDLDTIMFYTGWNFYMKSEIINGKSKIVPQCEKLNNF